MKQFAVLKEDFETRTIKKIVQGKEVLETVPRLRKGQEFEIFTMDLYWMNSEEKGGLGISPSMMEYLRLTNPDGTPTQFYALFEIVSK